MTTLRRALGALAAAGVVAATLVVGAPVARAEQGLTVAATSRYVYDAEAQVVRATMTLDLSNVSPDRQSGGGVYTYFFQGYSVPIPQSSARVRAQSDGSRLDVRVGGTDDPSIALARITFPDLRYRQSRRIVLTYEIRGRAPRSTDSTRVGPGYATFVAYGPGDEGSNRVEVVAPSAMSFTSTVDGFEDETSGGVSTYTATRNTFDGGLWSVVSLRDPDQVRESTVRVEDLSFTLSAFPDDDLWSSFVSTTVRTGLPTLETLVGNPWPGGLEQIREDASPSLRGYDGWFDPQGDEIVVGEQLDDDLIYHELSHAWVSGDRFDQRWLYEGLAQVIAERTVQRTGGRPTKHPVVSRRGTGAVALNDWDGDAGSRSTDLETYAYPASYAAMKALLGSLDDQRFAAVVGAGIRGERAYDPPGTVTPSAGRTSWSDWLDLVETRGGVTTAPKVFTTWVLDGKQVALLAPRARERAAYSALDEADGAWLPPEGLRDALSSWDFDRSRAVRGEIAPLGAGAAAVQDAAQRTGLPVPAAVRQAYERASVDDDYRALGTSLPAAAAAITAVARARTRAAALDDPFSELGARLLEVPERTAHATALLADGRVAPAVAAAADVSHRAGWAPALGAALPAAALLLVAALGSAVVLAVRRSRRRAQSTRSIRTLPRVLGLTRSRSRNSATPSS
ncbi:hypothetical protein [Phycicoccus duodecadis]|uniref:Uncharacterized protein n=1 Tax=Phycicoccus duodecadis TaxID=173053 RepID=A0A2N3YM52_9MICO|nr:hypothetical protein [Phycicoccus duodecadis]PKW27914.1 hypothetical protein ATL31_2765 [Phycicoccus duodecadis]